MGEREERACLRVRVCGGGTCGCVRGWAHIVGLTGRRVRWRGRWRGPRERWKAALEWAQNQNTAIKDVVSWKQVQNPADAGRQLHAVLAQLCDGEALDLVQNTADRDGWAAWRVTRRFDPRRAGKRRNIMPELLQPGSCDPEDLNRAIAKWTEQAEIYENRSLPITSRAAFSVE